MEIQADRTGHQVRVHIDQHSYESATPTTGEALYQLAHIRPELLLYKEVGGDREDQLVSRDSQEVHLHEDEHFHSAPARHDVTIFVNTEPFPWDRPKITYEDVVKLAFPNGPFGGDVRYSVMWTKPVGEEGALRIGQSVKVVNKMAFDVANPDKS
ncbi:MAG TPA: multiubiquitin domain-containing protein [Nitrospiraceae bacterium]|nr:multiubiquitin domain-containing protein [Nitrospiraceae bacterium]